MATPSDSTWRSDRASSNALRLAAAGCGDLPTAVVFESGLGASRLGWQPVVDRLPRSVPAVTYDRCGLGQKAAATGRRGLDELAAGLVALLDQTCPQRQAVLVGHSWGATVVRAAAHRRPGRVAALVLVDPVPDSWILRWGYLLAPAAALLYWALASAARLGLLGALLRSRRCARLLAGRAAALAAGPRQALLVEMSRPDHHRAGAREFAGMVRHSRSSLRALTTHALDAPVVVVSGGGGGPARVLRRRALSAHRELADLLGGQHVILPAGGHFLPREQPALLAAVVASLCPAEHRIGGKFLSSPVGTVPRVPPVAV